MKEIEEFQAAARHIGDVFHNPKNKRYCTRMRPHFWAALVDLEMLARYLPTTIETDPWEDVVKYFKKCVREIGPPGDFGYGNPCGDSVKHLYDAWNRFVKAYQEANTDATPEALK